MNVTRLLQVDRRMMPFNGERKMKDDPIHEYLDRLIESAHMVTDNELHVVAMVAAQVLEDSIETARQEGDITVFDVTVQALRESVGA